VLLARVIRRVSLRQDRDPAPEHHQSLVRWSAIFVVVFGLTILPASVDWVMSLDPHWASTIFAVYLVAGVLQSGLAALTIIVVLLRERGPLAEVVRDDHLHDLGKLLLGFSTFWAYMWLSQYLLIWYANLPEEVSHYIRRTSGGWLPLFLLNVTINWVVPFLVLLPRSAKRHHRVLLGVSLLVLLGHWLDLYLLVMPEMRETPSLNAVELIVAAGYMGLFLLMTSRALAAAPLVPLHDPYLSESLNHGG
jgi:Ni/Fe-hydrogenase subunit HybB-like protein